MEDLARCPGIGERKVSFHVVYVLQFVCFFFFLFFFAHWLYVFLMVSLD